MNKNTNLKINYTEFYFLVLFFLLILLSVSAVGKIIYVNAGTGNSSSWPAAYTYFQDALKNAAGGDEIWVARGTYKPSRGIDRNLYFKLKSGIAIYGGFVGIETARSQRNFRENASILSGDIGEPDDVFDNSYSVIKAIDIKNTRIDGFIIANGRADECG